MRSRAHGVQLRLGEDPATAADRLAQLNREVALQSELTELGRLLESQLHLSPRSAATELSHLAAAVRQSGTGSLRTFLADVDAIEAAIRSPERRETRRERYRAIRDAVEMVGGPDSVNLEVVDRLFAGRARELPGLADIELGGSVREVRSRRYPTWIEGDKLIPAAAGRGGARGARDAALLALHLRSGLPPGRILELSWEVLTHLRTSLADDLGEVELAHRGRPQRYVIHATAIEALAVWRRAEGAPIAGPVFTTLRRPRERLSRATAAQIIRDVTNEIGLPNFDRRHLRAPLAWWLKQRGWSELRIRDAFGLGLVRDVRRMIQPLAELAAQRQATEILTVSSASPIGHSADSSHLHLVAAEPF